jgi:hypothetical protein
MMNLLGEVEDSEDLEGEICMSFEKFYDRWRKSFMGLNEWKSSASGNTSFSMLQMKANCTRHSNRIGKNQT